MSNVPIKVYITSSISNSPISIQVLADNFCYLRTGPKTTLAVIKMMHLRNIKKENVEIILRFVLVISHLNF